MDKKLVDELNRQIKEELNSAYVYAAMASDLENKNWKGTAQWFKKQAHEEVEHAFKFYGYLNSRGEKAIFDAIEKPQESYGSILETFEKALAHERFITGRIHGLVRLAREKEDLPTDSFLQWFVTEQVEEEAKPEEIVQRLKTLGDAPQLLYMLDRELGSRE